MWRSRNSAIASLALAACLVPPKPSAHVASGGHASAGDEHDVLENSGFDDGKSLPWTSVFSEPGRGKVSVDGGELCTEIDSAGKNNWDVQVRQRGMTIRKGHHYTVRFRARASAPTTIRPKVGMQGAPYTEHWFAVVPLGAERRLYEDAFTMDHDDDATAELAFHMGGPLTGRLPVTVCLDDVVLEDPEFVRGPAAPPEPEKRVLVDQIGYLPAGAKIGVIRSEAVTPIPWELRDRDGKVVAHGETTVIGQDAASGDHVHHADFTRVDEPGEGYVLVAEGESSYPFAIAPDIYRGLARDALRFFYHSRSGVPIAMPYAQDKQWARPAGHARDSHARCLPGSGCDYALDASGGWYDAGDQGKYVVNGGIAVWTLLDQYERARRAGARAPADSELNIPESGNGVPDLLDEARFELAFLLAMQVPDGKPLAGMAHHKLHDESWTAIPTAPHEDKQPRYLYPPSTAATLNLAAVAAQGARVFEQLDPVFAQKCLRAAERAWVAAAAHPALYAPDVVKGGGPYDDRDVSDEQYWAAAELYITTGKDIYRAAVVHSPHHTRPITGGMTWKDTAVMGAISLALAERDPELRAATRARIVAAADRLLAISRAQGYRLPFAGENGGYPWGSNSFALNNAILLALAHDFTGAAKYRDGVTAALDYVLGENPLARSYVTGYGSRTVQNPHHRFWAHQADPAYPNAPPGALAGGPDSHLEDPYVQAAGMKGCAPERCYQDNIESYSTNEVAINWNAPLAWIAAYLTTSAGGGGANR
jgi:endoglucanase